ncbi:Ubiquitin supergroup [Penicillium digitatum]|uniref:Ubiquitin supergroup n=3 Tax=Penicillium digitatum TaxID=36651 RepID=A0A7T6XJ24_PENDI|nr:putative fungal protein [Penicillium digitatum Pd1]EKV09165.1 putative fungal protein [Penicillium digitatum Pd1]EKV10538.1 putative fungal protein [Penicillium digitatum PHI26]KAG0158476.1 hypothetical protein PDIDSM_5991 [Penicillium digitatum]QQK42030.1 Ubiquitin supergroup [Penicillium digitatum]
MATGLSSQPMVEGDASSTITLHILCQSLPPPSRFTLKNVPLSSTIAQLKGRIEQTFPNNPQASHQRLIYRGKPLTVDDATLSAVVSSMEEGIDSMHLVLPPEPTHSEAPPAPEMSQHSPLGNSAQASTSSSTGLDGPNPDISVTTDSISSYSSTLRQTDATPGSPNVTFNQYVNGSSLNPYPSTTNAPEAHSAELSQHIRTLRGQTEDIERELDRRILPSMQDIIRIRNQLLEIQDARPTGQLPLPGVAELVARILDAQQRARLTEYVQHRHLQTSILSQNSLQPGPTQVFMLSSPIGDFYSGLMGQNHLITRPTMQQAVLPNTAPANEPGAPQPPRVPQAPRPPNPNAAVVQNALRQALLNQQRRGNNVEHAGLARHIRRIWLFTRLWLFCYLTSAPGTWRRYIFVSIALLVTLFSETNIPRQFATTIISPVQRHLESLTHVGGPADRATQLGADDAAAEFNIWDQIRRAERALVFLFASLVPGLGERHVQARTAADQAFLAQQERRARESQEQEQARERERQEQEQEQERAQAGVAEGAGNAGAEQE